MKRVLSAALCVLILMLCGGCGSSRSGDTAADPAADAPSAAATEEAVEAGEESATATAPSPAVSPGATVVESQNCYDEPYCFRPQEDGTYHFSARTADDFQGKDVDYDSDAITWSVYVLEEEFNDAWRLMDQANSPAILDLNSSIDLFLKQGEYVYCICSLNSFTGLPASDGAGVLTITLTASTLVPDKSNNYQIPVTVNSETRFDLDGDGTEETIFYCVQADQPDANNVWLGAKPLRLSVNGTEYLHPERDNPMEEFGFWMENPETSCYYIVDLDTSDCYREIAIADLGSNGWFTTHYFRYEDGNLVYLGKTSGLPDEHTTVFYGDGTVSAMRHLNVMQTWSGLRTYRLEDGQMQLQTGQFCQPVLPEGWNVTLKQAIAVYEKPDLEAKTLTLQPSASALSFPSTDGEHWVEIVCADGSRGWAYFSDFSTLESGGASLPASEVFGNLFLAG